MARQKGIIQLEGTLGDINFYFRKGKPVARKAGGGFNAKNIKTSATMVRVRENNTEFGNCSKVKKVFRLSLHPFLNAYKEGTLHGRMMQLLQQIKTFDTISERGKRTVGNGIQTPNGKIAFQQFLFTPKRSVSKTLMATTAFDWENYSYTVCGFKSSRVRFPVSATHFELSLGVLCFDFATLTHKMFMGAPLLIARDFKADTFSLKPTHLPEAYGMQFAFVGLQFFQEVNGIMYLLQEEGAIGLELVGIEGL